MGGSVRAQYQIVSVVGIWMSASTVVFRDEGIVIGRETRYSTVNFEGSSLLHIVEYIPDVVGGAAKYRLSADSALGGVYASIPHDTDIVHATVGFNKVIHLEV